MKSLGLGILHLSLLAVLFACGKNNESGKKNTYYSNGNPYYGGQYGTIGSTGFPAVNGVSVDQVLAQTPCLTSGAPNQARIRVQFPLTGYPNMVPANDLYVGVTTSGDVAVLQGQGPNPPLFVSFMCQRAYGAGGQGQLMDLAIGSSSKCSFKPLLRATMIVPGLAQPLYFRWLDGGRLNPQTGQLIPYVTPVCF